ncbi:MAG: tRNA nucleotidyltransferase [Hyphomicrobiales bacterium]|nr:AAA family ATPase [Hyphomicrobiales bacterium]PCJ88210.1 MAG: tRNA nucleotidyltransferase [Hyphomicrobiales bacterium]
MKGSKSVVFEKLRDLVPRGPEWSIDWSVIWGLFSELSALDDCPQDPIHHAEGDVGKHTRMVVEALVAMEDWQALPPIDQSILFWASCFHDIGKLGTTKHEEDGRISSRGHSRLGAAITRGILRDIGADFYWREAVCGIILKHQLPFWLIERSDPERMAIETSLVCRPNLLCLHAQADALGRICNDKQNLLDNVALAKEVFIKMDCLDDPFPFANDESRLAFLGSENRDPHYAAYEDFRCTAYVMSALPGSGKDTWIACNLSGVPMVSLDVIRKEIGVSATGNQGRVIQAAYELAKTHLRNGRDFVWNATNVTQQTRGKVLRLLRGYGALIHIIYIEVLPAQLDKQNTARHQVVPKKVGQALARKLEPPSRSECHLLTNVLPPEICDTCAR